MFAKWSRQHSELWLSASRDGMVMMLPITLIRVAIRVAMNFPWAYWPVSWWQPFDVPWGQVATKLDATLGIIMGLGLALCVGNRLFSALQRADNAWLTPMLVSLLCVLNFSISMMSVSGSPESFVGQSLLLGMLTGIITVEMLHLHIRLFPKALRIGGLDGSMLFRRSFQQLGPAAFTCVVTALVMVLLTQFGSQFTQAVRMLLETDVIRPDSAYVLNLLIILANQLLWSVGLHGGILVPTFAGTLLAAPGVLFDANLASRYFINAFAYMGGSGATWGLVLALFMVCKDQQMRRLGRYSVLPAVFNVNEILVFGLPIVFSPIMIIPFLLAPLASAAVAMAAIATGWLELSGQQTQWSTPILISGYLLSGGFVGVITQLLGLLVSTAIYLPFVRKLETKRRKTQTESLSKAMIELCEPVFQNNNLLQRLDALGDFARALHADFEAALGSTQVFQVYQPKHDAFDRICGVEALLRWNHPVHGPIMPAAIINVAEESGLINKIGRWSLEAACSTLQQWKRQGVHGVSLSVNLSPVQLDDTSFVVFVQHCLKKYDLNAAELKLEITEGRTLAPTQQANSILTALSALGVQLSMDDFGMGYSSLLYMQRFSMSEIKIDGSLTRDVMTNSVSSDIIRTIGLLGKKQGVRVVAEFVETAEQRDKLAELGCDEFQGYLYSPAITSQAFLPYWHSSGEAQPRML